MSGRISRPLRVDFVAPPFAGHLFPQLDLICGFSRKNKRDDSEGSVKSETAIDSDCDAKLFLPRLLTTATAAEAVEQSCVPLRILLRGYEQQVAAIADKGFQVSHNPIRLFRQFKENLALMPLLRDELTELWTADPPDIAVVDFCVPIAGHVAKKLGIPWWTTMPTPCALETSDGVPSYQGGLKPAGTLLTRFQNWRGRMLVRAFKRAVFAVCRKQLAEIGMTRLYRNDGSEMAYSDKLIFGLGAREFEFNSDWPKCFQFIGPLTGCPPTGIQMPDALLHGPTTSRKRVLISLGTHLQWAKDQLVPMMIEIAQRMPNVDFHFAMGNANAKVESQSSTSDDTRQTGNLHIHAYLPYGKCCHCFDAALVHGGTGVVYSCLKAAVPMLVWPQDFDQFDHAARVEYNSLGLRCRGTPQSIVEDLGRLLDETEWRDHCTRLQEGLQDYDPHEAFRAALRRFAASQHNSPALRQGITSL